MNADFIQEAQQHFNEPILVGFDLGRCVGYAEDDNDCYLLVQFPHRGLTRCTFVGGYVYLDRLKGQGYVRSAHTDEAWDDLYRLDSLLALNGAPKEPEFLLEINSDAS